MPSISYLQSRIKFLQQDLSSLNKKMADEKKKESNALSKRTRAEGSINSRMSESTIRTKQREIERANNDIVRSQNKQSDLMKDINRKTEELNKRRLDLFKEQEIETDKITKAQQKKIEEQEKKQRDLMNQLHKQQLQLTQQPEGNNDIQIVEKEYDVFISHASEDDEYAGELSKKLIEKGIKVWFDGSSLHWGDKIRQSIDLGLTRSRFGIVILSATFLKKYWTNYELDGLLSLDTTRGGSFILPIWYRITKDDILKSHPSIANIEALDTSLYSINDIVKEVKQILR